MEWVVPVGLYRILLAVKYLDIFHNFVDRRKFINLLAVLNKQFYILNFSNLWKKNLKLFTIEYCSDLYISFDFTFQDSSVRYLPGFGPAVPQECSDCGKKYNMGGPIWSAPIHDQEWVTSILKSVKSMKDRYPAYDRISAVLTTISEVSSCAPFLALFQFSSAIPFLC
jgi:tRNA G26 N,N-dimethylase Trm1